MNTATTANIQNNNPTAFYHLPGLFEFYELYRIFLPLFRKHREYFYDWCEIGSIYGAPSDCIWGGGRTSFGYSDPEDVLDLVREYGISARLTFSNSLLREEHLTDKKCNELCKMFEHASDADNSPHTHQLQNGVIVHSELLLNYLQKNYPDLYLISSTTKVLTDFQDFLTEINREDFRYIVPDFRLNKVFDKLDLMSQHQKDSGEGYLFSKAMANPGFISVTDIKDIYLPMGFSNFKIEGRGLGSALILEFLLYYMTKPEYQLHVREEIYLDNMLDLF